MKKVLCHGVFDVLHVGHMKYFNSAKKHGDYLIVSITADEFVNKGPGRPYFTTDIRKQMLEALQIVDEVVISHSPLAVDVINDVQPDVYVKGPDYSNKEDDPTGGIIEEEAAVLKWGGEVVFTEDDTFSSSTLINKFFYKRTPSQEEIIDQVQSLGGLDTIMKVLEDISKLKVAVVGEPIEDIYTFCRAEGISNKNTSISARHNYTERYTGGTSAVVKHIDDFVMGVSFNYDKRFACKKTRYICKDSHQRLFELTHIIDDQWDYYDPGTAIEDMFRLSSNSDMTLLCDFGHGLFQQEFLKACGEIPGFVALNVQTNSSNLGFNPFTKHKRFDYLTMDIKEARIATHDRYSDRLTLFNNVRSMIQEQCSHASMTLGSNGSFFANTNTKHIFKSPAFASNVVDPIGAGDAFFAITSLLVRAGCPDEMVPFLGNIFAGLKTKIIGNKEPVKKADFIKAVKGILK